MEDTKLNKGLISVIMPCFNAEKYLRQAIGSVLGQTYDDIELIVVNDGSTDNSKEILSSLVAECPGRITILHQDHKGAYPARNLGLKNAEGEFIAFLDADDYWDNNFLKKLSDAIINNQADLAYCGWQNIGKEKPLENQPYIPPKYENGDIIVAFLKSCPWPIHAALVRRDVVEQINGFSQRYFSAMDYDFWLRVIAKTRNIILVPEVLAFYRWHSKEQISKTKWKQTLDAWKVRRDFVSANLELVKHIDRKEIRELINTNILKDAYKTYWAGDLVSAFQLFRKAFMIGEWGLKDAKYVLPALLPEKLYVNIVRSARKSGK